eukprot:gene16257-biopygen2233
MVPGTQGGPAPPPPPQGPPQGPAAPARDPGGNRGGLEAVISNEQGTSPSPRPEGPGAEGRGVAQRVRAGPVRQQQLRAGRGGARRAGCAGRWRWLRGPFFGAWPPPPPPHLQGTRDPRESRDPGTQESGEPRAGIRGSKGPPGRCSYGGRRCSSLSDSDLSNHQLASSGEAARPVIPGILGPVPPPTDLWRV